MRRRVMGIVACLGVLLALAPSLAAGGDAATTANSPSCLRGSWKAGPAESQRVLKALVPGPYTFNSVLYMVFNRTTMQYGTTSFVLRSGNSVAKGLFFTLSPYTATNGVVRTGRGTSTIEFTQLTIGGHSATPPASMTRPIPGGSTPFECSGNRLRYKLRGPAGWLNLNRSAR